MMTDLKDQLRAYFDVVDPPFDTAKLMPEPLSELSPERSRVGRGVLVAAATAVVILLVAGVPLLLSGGREETVLEPSATTALPTTVDAAPATVAPAASADPEDVADLFACLPLDPSGWSQSEPLPFRSEERGLQLAANDSVAVAVWEGGGVEAYWSSDGLEWEPAEGFPDFHPGMDWPTVAGGARGFVAVAQGPGGDEELPAVVAFSADGITWERIDPESLPKAKVQLLYDVIAGPDGFIILGASGWESLAWFSADGRTWVDSGLPTDGFDDLRAVVPTESGWAAMKEKPSPSLWESSDGTTWNKTEFHNAPPGVQFTSYLIRQSPQITVNGTWVLVNELGNDNPTAWVSNDNGANWNAYPIRHEFASGEATFFDLDVTPFGLLLASRHGMFYSQDGGTTWHYCRIVVVRTGSDVDVLEVTQVAMLGDKLIMFDGLTGTFETWTDPAIAP